MKRSKIESVLAYKESELAHMTRRSGSAIQAVRDSIDNLIAINEGIDALTSEIDAYAQRLGATRNGLSEQKQKNQQIVQNFKSLLCEE